MKYEFPRRTFRAPDEPRETEKELNGFTKSLIIELRELGGHRRSKPRRIRWMHKKPKRTHSQSVETERQNREPRTSTRGASRHRRQHSHRTSKLGPETPHKYEYPKTAPTRHEGSKQLQSKAPSRTPKNKESLNRLVDAQERRSPCHIRTPKREDPNPISGHLES